MRKLDELLAEDIEGYLGRQDDLIFYVPNYFRLLANMLEDPSFPRQLRPLVLAGVGYFALPDDIIPVRRAGPFGYADDLFLAAFIVERVRQEEGQEATLTANWDAERPLWPLNAEILARQVELIGDQRDTLFAFIGYGE